jgi:hypothetical protein
MPEMARLVNSINALRHFGRLACQDDDSAHQIQFCLGYEVTSVNMVEIRVLFGVAIDHAAMVAIWVCVTSMVGAVSSAIGSVCM